MWIELVCGLVLYRFVKRFFQLDDAVDDLDSSHFNSIFAVAKRMEKLFHGCRVHVGLQIPDHDSASRKNIDIVIVTDQEAVVISVKNNLSGFVSIDKDSNWVCTDAKSRKTERFPDPVAETKQLVSILEEYLEQRGVALPEGYLSFKVICPSPCFPCNNTIYFPPEVTTYEQWKNLIPEQRSSYSRWINGSLLCGKKKMQESFFAKLNSVLSTAPISDRLELKDNKYILGEFLEFKGRQDDLQALRKVKRSKIGRLTVQTISVFGFVASTVQVRFSPRDYRAEGASRSSKCEEITIRGSTEVVFQLQNSKKLCKYKLSSIVSIELSA